MASKFNAFEVTDITYKIIDKTPLKASILIPKKAKNGNLPLLVHFHGGGLIMGDRMFADWYPKWLIDFSEAQEAIVVTPDYRLIPEANGLEQLDDVQDLWKWVHQSLPTEISKISSKLSVNLDRIAVAGESAGGYLSLQSALIFPSANIKLIMSQYGPIDIDHPAYNPVKPTIPPPESSFVSKYLKALSPGAIRLSSPMPQKWDLVEAILTEGRHRELIGNEEKNHLIGNLERAKEVPPMWLAQGKDDPIMPLALHLTFVQNLKEFHPTALLHESIQAGGHGFDAMTSMNEDWVKKGVEFAKKYW